MIKQNQLPSSAYPLSDGFCSRDFPFYWVARLNALYSACTDNLLKPKGLSSSKWRILMILHEYGRLSMSSIATHAVSNLSTVTKIVYSMQEDELVLTAPSTEDRRITEVTLTAKGEEQLLIARELVTRLAEKAFRGLESEEVAVLNSCLNKMFVNLSVSDIAKP